MKSNKPDKVVNCKRRVNNENVNPKSTNAENVKTHSKTLTLCKWDYLCACTLVGLLLCCRQYKLVVEDLSDATRELNLTKNCREDILIFNRVPKVGSVTIKYLVGVLRDRNNFTAFSSVDKMPVQMAVEAILQARNTSSPSKPILFVKHHNYFDFAEFGHKPSPIYMNFVRHPVHRIISWYYYVRAPWYQFEEKHNRTVMKNNWPRLYELKSTFEECVKGEWRKCRIHKGLSINSAVHGTPDYVSQASFFCGHSEECDILESPALLAKAKHNVDRYYAVVGVLEEWQKSLTVLEAFLPRYFAGARSTLQREEHKDIRHLNKNIFKPKTDRDVVRMLEERLKGEMEFYHYVRQRLNKQYELVKDLTFE